MQEKEKEENDAAAGGTERSRLARETTGEDAPNADRGSLAAGIGRKDEKDDFDATSGAGGTTAGGGTSGVPT